MRTTQNIFDWKYSGILNLNHFRGERDVVGWSGCHSICAAGGI